MPRTTAPTRTGACCCVAAGCGACASMFTRCAVVTVFFVRVACPRLHQAAYRCGEPRHRLKGAASIERIKRPCKGVTPAAWSMAPGPEAAPSGSPTRARQTPFCIRRDARQLTLASPRHVRACTFFVQTCIRATLPTRAPAWIQTRAGRPRSRCRAQTRRGSARARAFPPRK